MPDYQYKAMAADGQVVEGVVGAESRAQAISTLAEGGTFVTDIDRTAALVQADAGSVWSLPVRRRVSGRAKTAMFQQLAVALQSGLPLLDALQIVAHQAESPALSKLAHDLSDSVRRGEALSDAMGEHQRVFTALETSMTRVGEAAGKLDEVMGYLAEFAQRDQEARQKIRSAAAYPLFVFGLAIVSVMIVLAWILPRIMATVLDQAGEMTLPLPTRALLAISRVVWSPYGLLLAVALGLGVWAFRRWVRQPAGRLAVDRFVLRVPVLGTAVRKVAVARFARTLGTLHRAGVEIIEAMHVLRDTLGNEALAQQIDSVTADITQGQSIAEPLRRTGQFPPLLIQVIAMGERTGKLDDLLLQTADSLEKETAAALARVLTILPAVFIVCLALLVLFILAAVLLPIVGLDAAVTGA